MTQLSANDLGLLSATIGFLASILGAIVGGVITWITARAKLQRERSFDRQLEWHERMHQALFDVASKSRRVIRGIERGEVNSNLALKEISPELRALARERGNALLYGSAGVVDSVEGILRRLWDEETTALDPNRPGKQEEVIAALYSVRAAHENAMHYVAGEARSLIGLSEIERDVLERSTLLRRRLPPNE